MAYKFNIFTARLDLVGTGGGSTINFSDNETPSGTINGSNTVFTIAHTPTTGSLQLFRNGVLQVLTTNYTLVGATITFILAPQVNNTLRAWYRY